MAGKIGFDEKWLRMLAVDPAQLSLMRVDGESMAPVLNNGNDIMVDSSAATGPLGDGIHVIQMDDVLMVKRLAKGPASRLSVLLDNPAYPDRPEVDGAAASVIERGPRL